MVLFDELDKIKRRASGVGVFEDYLREYMEGVKDAIDQKVLRGEDI